jgi:hypothetical protein
LKIKKNNLLKVRKIYSKIYDKEKKEEDYTENEIALLLAETYKEALETIMKNKETTNINNNNTISSTTASTNNNKN